MKKCCVALVSLILCMVMINTASAGNWEFLFNGKNLDGWKVIGSPEWKVENGVIQVKGMGEQMGWLVAEKPYSDFVFRARFKWTGGNSGIQIRSKLNGDEMTGYQCNLDPSRPTATGTIVEEHGRGIIREPKVKAEEIFKENEWNEYEISAIGYHTVIWVNGVKMVDVLDNQGATEGILALQMDPKGEGTMEWTDIRILPISNKKDWESLFNGKDLTGWKPFGDSTWSVVDGAIYGKYQNKGYGWLLTDKEYQDFHLSLRFKVPSGNSGIQFRSWPVDSEKIVHGFQADIASDSDWISGHLYDQSEKGITAKPNFDTSKIIDWNGWNTYEITAVGPNVELFINGIKTIEHDDPTRTKAGIFAFQIHAGIEMETWWKDLRIIQF